MACFCSFTVYLCPGFGFGSNFYSPDPHNCFLNMWILDQYEYERQPGPGQDGGPALGVSQHLCISPGKITGDSHFKGTISRNCYPPPGFLSQNQDIWTPDWHVKACSKIASVLRRYLYRTFYSVTFFTAFRISCMKESSGSWPSVFFRIH